MLRSLLEDKGYKVVIFAPADTNSVGGRPRNVRKVEVVAEQLGDARDHRREKAGSHV